MLQDKRAVLFFIFFTLTVLSDHKGTKAVAMAAGTDDLLRDGPAWFITMAIGPSCLALQPDSSWKHYQRRDFQCQWLPLATAVFPPWMWNVCVQRTYGIKYKHRDRWKRLVSSAESVAVTQLIFSSLHAVFCIREIQQDAVGFVEMLRGNDSIKEWSGFCCRLMTEQHKVKFDSNSKAGGTWLVVAPPEF